MMLGEDFKAEIIVNMNELSGADIGMEIVVGQKVNDESKRTSFYS